MEIELDRNAWHRRLQTQMIGKVEFENFCPYFWMTIACLVGAPFFFPYQAAKWLLFEGSPYVFTVLGYILSPVLHVFELGLNALDSTVCLPLQTAALDYIDERRLLSLYECSRYAYMGDELKGSLLSDRDALEKMLYYKLSYGSGKGAKGSATKRLLRMDAKFCLWKKNAGDDWRAKLEEVRKKDEARRAAEYAKERADEQATYQSNLEAGKRRKRILGNVVIWTQRLAPYALAVVGMLLLWLLCAVLISVNWAHVFMTIGKIILTILMIPVDMVYWVFIVFRDLYRMGPMFSGGEKGAMMIVPLVGALFIKLSRKCDLEIPFVRQLRVIGRWLLAALKIVFLPIALLVDGMVEFAKFVTDYIVLFKKDHCPHIKWTN